MPDHVHILTGLHPIQSISSIVQNVKSESTKWINREKLTGTKFAWQEGYGAFSYAHNEVRAVIRYIQNQKVHHRTETFLDEYKKLLIAFDIEFNQDYIFKELA